MRCSAPARKGIHFWKLAHTSAHSCGMRRAAAAAARPRAGARPAAPSLPSASQTGGTREGSGKTEFPGTASMDGVAEGVPRRGFYAVAPLPQRRARSPSPGRGWAGPPGTAPQRGAGSPGGAAGEPQGQKQYSHFNIIQVCLASTLYTQHKLNYLPRYTGVLLRTQSTAGAGCRLQRGSAGRKDRAHGPYRLLPQIRRANMRP